MTSPRVRGEQCCPPGSPSAAAHAPLNDPPKRRTHAAPAPQTTCEHHPHKIRTWTALHLSASLGVLPPCCADSAPSVCPRNAVTQGERGRPALCVRMSATSTTGARDRACNAALFKLQFKRFSFSYVRSSPNFPWDTGKPARAGLPVCMWTPYLHSLGFG